MPASLTVESGIDIAQFAGSVGAFVIGSSGLPADATTMSATSMTVGDGGMGDSTVYSGSLSFGSNLNIGVNGMGAVSQEGGTVSATFLDMSSAVGGGDSSYTLSGGL